MIVVLHQKINLPQFFVEQIDPPSSVADAPASPQGEAFYVTSLVRRISTFSKTRRIQNLEKKSHSQTGFPLARKISTFFEAQRIRNPKSKIALSNRLPLGGKLARQRLMRGDKSSLSPFDISTPVDPAPLLLIGTFFTASFLRERSENRSRAAMDVQERRAKKKMKPIRLPAGWASLFFRLSFLPQSDFGCTPAGRSYTQ